MWRYVQLIQNRPKWCFRQVRGWFISPTSLDSFLILFHPALHVTVHRCYFNHSLSSLFPLRLKTFLFSLIFSTTAGPSDWLLKRLVCRRFLLTSCLCSVHLDFVWHRFRTIRWSAYDRTLGTRMSHRIVFTAPALRNADAVIARGDLSVCLSVRLSVRHVPVFCTDD